MPNDKQGAPSARFTTGQSVGWWLNKWGQERVPAEEILRAAMEDARNAAIRECIAKVEECKNAHCQAAADRLRGFLPNGGEASNG